MRAWVLARLSVALSLMADESRRRSLSEEAVAVARAIGDRRALGYALAAHCDATSGPDHCDDRVAASAEIVRLGAETGDRQLELLGLRLRVVALLEIGDIGAADVAVERFALIAERLRQPLYRWYVPLWRGMRALMRGELGAAARYCADAEQLGAQAASGNAVALTFTQWWVRQRYEGHQAEAGSAMADLLESGVGRRPGSPPDRARWSPRSPVTTRRPAPCSPSGWPRACPTGPGTPSGCRSPPSSPRSRSRREPGTRRRRLYADLRPYAHRFCVEGIGAAFTGSVAWYLAAAGQVPGPDRGGRGVRRAGPSRARPGRADRRPAAAGRGG